MGRRVWAVPLWSERGLIGVLLLGESWTNCRREEIEIARATGERLIDAQASAQMAQRLMALQRQRLAESQVLTAAPAACCTTTCCPCCTQRCPRAGDGRKPGRRLGPGPAARPVSDRACWATRTTASRTCCEDMLHRRARYRLAGAGEALRKAVEEDFAGAFDPVEWQVDPAVNDALNDISPLSSEVVFYAAREAIRNAARYGRDNLARPLHLRVAAMCRRPGDTGGGRWGGFLGAQAEAAPANGHATNGVNGRWCPRKNLLATSNGSAGGSGQGLPAQHDDGGGRRLAVHRKRTGEYTRVVLSLPAGS